MKKILLFIAIILAQSINSQAVLVKDIETGSLSSMPNYTENRVDYDGQLLFTVLNNASNNYHLWSTDGTESGTKLLKEFVDYATFEAGYLTYSPNLNKVFLRGMENINAGFGNLYATDGTESNTSLVSSNSTYVKNITSFNGGVYYQGRASQSTGIELLYFDGTNQSTIDINPGLGSTFPSDLKVVGNKLYFSGHVFNGSTDMGKELYISDGTASGTFLLKNINTSSIGSDPKNFIEFNNKVYFTADNGTDGLELWETDGTEVNTKMVADLHLGNNPSFYVDPNFTIYKNELYFTGFTPAVGIELFKINTNGNISNVADINPGGANNSYPNNFFVFDGKLFFSADNGTDGYELWYTENTGGSTAKSVAVTTAIFKNINPSGDSNPSNFIEFDGKIYFNANNGTNGKELWESDGSVAGTIMKQDINPSGNSNPRDFIVSNNLLYFSANDGTNGDELWKYSNDFIIGNLYPKDNATAVQVSGETLKITLNRELVKGTGNIIIYKSSDDSVFETINVASSNVTISNNSATITPILNFSSSESYYVLIDNGALKDTSNNLFTGISDKTIWNFETFGLQNQTITFSALPSKTFGDADFQLTATASSNLVVTYTSSNLNVATINGNTVTIVGAGTATITASQAGDSNYNAATDVTQTLTVNKANQTITWGNISNKTFGDPDFELTATASSNLAITYTSSNTNVVVITGTSVKMVQLIGVGTVTITASQPGNTNYNPISISRLFVVNKANQTITFNALADVDVNDADFNLNATSDSGLPISYTSSNTNVATINGNVISIIAMGTTSITASQTGNTNYNPATNVSQPLTVTNAASTDNFTKLNFQIFPNPVSSTFEIKSEIKVDRIELYNILSQKVKEFIKPKDNKLSIKDLEIGVYLIKIHTEKGIATYKIFKIE